MVYLPACLDAAMWSYSYPYQRRLLTKAIEWAAGADHQFPFRIEAPKCVQTTFWHQPAIAAPDGHVPRNGNVPARGYIIHFFNGLNTTANHGLPAVDVPLREETVPIHGIKVHLGKESFRSISVEPGHLIPKVVEQDGTVLELPPLVLHQMLVLK